MLLFAFVEGSVAVFLTVAQLAAIRDVVSAEQRPSAFALFESQQQTTLLVGRAAGAALFGIAAWDPFVVGLVSYLGAFGALSRVRVSRSTPAPPPGRRQEPLWRRISQGLRPAWSLPFGRAGGCWSLVLLMFAVSTNQAVMAMAWTGVGVIGAVTNVALELYLADAVPEAVFGQAVGGVSAMAMVAAPTGPILGGYLIEVWGPRPTSWLRLPRGDGRTRVRSPGRSAGHGQVRLGCLRVTPFFPITALFSLDPAKAEVLVEAIQRRFPVPDGFAGQVLRDLRMPEPDHGPEHAGEHREVVRIPAPRMTA